MGLLLCAQAGLALLCAAGALAAAEPLSPSQGDPAWSTGCDRYMAVQDRLDVMEETAEKVVEHLEAEVKGLLGLLEELAWNLPPGPFSPAPDLLGDGVQPGPAGRPSACRSEGTARATAGTAAAER
ncbi:placenta-specific protein 9 isoform X2 [Marmota marmota marmota]|uniref:placenta-specific protein 9 isoform X2 n=1 Tax=Marmota marmota marmota TaxID=9994 RepID=UPI002091FA11|nr:placenta-specific protein 9 isoform X2 [Marmota marmota marmota]